jgi:hypothetical protein
VSIWGILLNNFLRQPTNAIERLSRLQDVTNERRTNQMGGERHIPRGTGGVSDHEPRRTVRLLAHDCLAFHTRCVATYRPMNGSSIHEFSKDQKEKTSGDDNAVLLHDGTLSDSGHYAQRGLANSNVRRMIFHQPRSGQPTAASWGALVFSREVGIRGRGPNEAFGPAILRVRLCLQMASGKHSEPPKESDT